MMKEAIAKLMNKQDLTYEEARQVMDEIMDGKVSATLISSYLTALSMKGETIDEISGSAYAMPAHATKAPHDMDVLEIVGTGGDGANTFNISSTSAMVIAAGGVPGGRQARKPCSLLQVRCCGRTGGAGRQHLPAPGKMPGTAGAGGHLLSVCPDLSHRHEVCGPRS